MSPKLPVTNEFAFEAYAEQALLARGWVTALGRDGSKVRRTDELGVFRKRAGPVTRRDWLPLGATLCKFCQGAPTR